MQDNEFAAPDAPSEESIHPGLQTVVELWWIVWRIAALCAVCFVSGFDALYLFHSYLTTGSLYEDPIPVMFGVFALVWVAGVSASILMQIKRLQDRCPP